MSAILFRRSTSASWLRSGSHNFPRVAAAFGDDAVDDRQQPGSGRLDARSLFAVTGPTPSSTFRRRYSVSAGLRVTDFLTLAVNTPLSYG
jgi:hypothetical protein